MTYEQYRCWILNNYPVTGTGPLVDLLAGSTAGGTAVLCTYPLDLARTKPAYQVTGTRGSSKPSISGLHTHPACHGVKDVLKSVYKEGGVCALYRGVGPTCTCWYPEEQQTSVIMCLSCGALAGLFGKTFTYPLDVVRRQMQVQGLQPAGLQGGPGYRNTMEGLTTIIRNQGWRQLFAGLSINYLKIVPSIAASLLVSLHTT